MYGKLQAYFKNLVRFSDTVRRQFLEDDCQGTAAALTYQTLFAVVPLLTVMYAIFNSVKAFAGLGERIQQFIFENVVPQNVSVVQQYLSSFSQQARSLSAVSIVLLAVTAFMMLFTIERIFNQIWRVREPRRGFQRFLMYWALLTLGPFLVGLGFVISGYVMSLPLISGVTESTGILRYVPVLLSAAMFTLVYVAVPNCVVPLKHAVSGGVLVAIVFELAKAGFAKIMAQSNFQVIYGAFAAVPLFLLWIFTSWTIVLLGAEVVKSLGVFRSQGDEHIESPMVQLLLILEQFYLAYQRGDVIRDSDIRRLSSRVDVAEWNDYKARLVELNLIKPVERGGLVLVKDLGEISVWDLYSMVPFDMPRDIRGDKSWEKLLANNFYRISAQSEAYLRMDLASLYAGRAEQVSSDAAENLSCASAASDLAAQSTDGPSETNDRESAEQPKNKGVA